MGSNEAAVIAQADAVWLDANRYYDAESRYYQVSVADMQRRANPGHSPPNKQSPKCIDKKIPMERKQKEGVSSLVNEIVYARQKIHTYLKSSDSPIDPGASIISRLEKLEQGFQAMLQRIDKLTDEVHMALSKAEQVHQTKETSRVPKKEDTKVTIQNGSSAAADDDDDIDLFGSDEEDDAAAAKVREERLQAYANKKAKKPALVAKSSVVLDVKPWDDETDMKELEKAVRGVQSDGLVWGASKLVPLAYGINKLQIVAVVEDEKVSIDWLQETICEIEDLVQSVDIAAFNKL